MIIPSFYLFLIFIEISAEKLNFKKIESFQSYFLNILLQTSLILICLLQIFFDFFLNEHSFLAFTMEKIIFIMNWISLLYLINSQSLNDKVLSKMIKKFYIMSFLSQIIVVLLLESQVVLKI